MYIRTYRYRCWLCLFQCLFWKATNMNLRCNNGWVRPDHFLYDVRIIQLTQAIPTVNTFEVVKYFRCSMKRWPLWGRYGVDDDDDDGNDDDDDDDDDDVDDDDDDDDDDHDDHDDHMIMITIMNMNTISQK